jgi:hypothetical protein
MFRNIQPYAIFIEGVFVRVEPFQCPSTGGVIAILIHRGILLMAENDPFTRAAFPAAFATLRTLGLLLITYSDISLSLFAFIDRNRYGKEAWATYTSVFEYDMSSYMRHKAIQSVIHHPYTYKLNDERGVACLRRTW